MSIPHIRTMKEAYAELKAADPDTAISFYMFRRRILSGDIPSFREGHILLVNMDHVYEYYRTAADEIDQEQPITGQIRPIKE